MFLIVSIVFFVNFFALFRVFGFVDLSLIEEIFHLAEFLTSPFVDFEVGKILPICVAFFFVYFDHVVFRSGTIVASRGCLFESPVVIKRVVFKLKVKNEIVHQYQRKSDAQKNVNDPMVDRNDVSAGLLKTIGKNRQKYDDGDGKNDRQNVRPFESIKNLVDSETCRND